MSSSRPLEYLWSFWGTNVTIWQIYLLKNALTAQTYTCYSFSSIQAYEKDYWCARPSDGIHSSMNVSMWKNITLQTTDSCQIHDTGANQMTQCESFEFSHDIMGTTIVEEFNLVCDKKYFLAVVEMSYLMGAAVASVVSGWISDRFGRRTILMCSATLQVIIGEYYFLLYIFFRISHTNAFSEIKFRSNTVYYSKFKIQSNNRVIKPNSNIRKVSNLSFFNFF